MHIKQCQSHVQSEGIGLPIIKNKVVSKHQRLEFTHGKQFKTVLLILHQAVKHQSNFVWPNLVCMLNFYSHVESTCPNVAPEKHYLKDFMASSIFLIVSWEKDLSQILVHIV